MKQTTKHKVMMLLSLLNNEFLKQKQEGNFKGCLEIEKSMNIVREVFKTELQSEI